MAQTLDPSMTAANGTRSQARSGLIIRQRRQHGPRTKRWWISLLKLFLLSLSAALILLMLFWPAFNSTDESGLSAPLESFLEESLGQLLVKEARINLTDTDGRPYMVTAKEIIQNAEQDNLYDLRNPVADLITPDFKWGVVEARAGAFDQINNSLRLTGDVTFDHADGYQLLTDDLHIDFKEGHAESTSQTFGQGAIGQFTADGFFIEDRGRVLRLKGKSQVTSHLEASHLKDGAPD